MSDHSKPKPTVVFVLGGPGSGKGTQCANIVRDYGFVHLSAGDLLREEQKKETDNAELIKSYIKDGKIVPVEITVNLLKAAIEENETKHGKSYFLIDGFPRNQNNLEGWEKIMKEDDVNVAFVLFFDCPEEVMEERLLNRGKTSGRADDNIESIKKRFKTFVQETLVVVNSFAEHGKVRKISSVDTPEKVFENVQKIFDQDFPQLIPPNRTFAFLKPDVVSKGQEEEILERIKAGGFEIVAQKKITLSNEIAGQFYAEHKERQFYGGLVAFMTSGPVVALILKKHNAIPAWRNFIGPTNSNKAREEKPESLRALYGTDGSFNAAHGSDSAASVDRESRLIFPELF